MNILSFIITFILILFLNYLITPWIFIPFESLIIKKIMFKLESIKFSKKNIEKSDLYFRELPASYSPAIVSVLSNSKNEENKDLPATMLYLCAKKILKIELHNNSVNFSYTPQINEKLLEHEKYIIKNLEKIHNKKFDYSIWKKIIIQDAINLNLIIDTDMRSRLTSYEPVIKLTILQKVFVVISSSISFISLLCSLAVALPNIIIYLLFLISIILSPTNCIQIFYAINQNKYGFSFNRTKKGVEDYKKWLNFKHFLEDYSLIHSRNIEEIHMWEHYLAFAITFNLNKKIIKTFNNKLLKYNSINYFEKFFKDFSTSKSYF